MQLPTEICWEFVEHGLHLRKPSRFKDVLEALREEVVHARGLPGRNSEVIAVVIDALLPLPTLRFVLHDPVDVLDEARDYPRTQEK